MLNKIINAVEPFALTIIILAGASMAGWVSFSNRGIIGIVTVFFGVLLILNHIVKQVTKQTIKKG